MKTKIFFGVSLFNLLFYLAMESIWSGIQGMFGLWWLQYLFLALIVSLFIVMTVLLAKKTSGKAPWVFGGLSLAFTIALGYMFYLGIGSLRYILRNYIIYSLAFALAFVILYLFLEFPKKQLWRKRSFRLSFLFAGLLVLLGICFLSGFVMIRQLPTVFAVEEEYQIVWTTTINATGQVKVGDNLYSETYSGSLDSETTVHKVVVPMSELDMAKEYEIISGASLFRVGKSLSH